MPTTVQFRRGNTAAHNTFTGGAGEITIDTSKNTVVVHDGSTAGGFPLAKYSDVTAYATNSQLASYATNAQLATYATNAQLATYATNAQLATYATNAQLALYATNAQLSSYALDADLTTANVAELTNLYFTNARSRASLSAGTGVQYDQSTGAISISQNVDASQNITFANLTITGNLTVLGNTVQFNANTLTVTDPLIQVGVNNNSSDVIDLGFFGHYYGGSPAIERHAGLFRDATDGQFKLFTNLDPTPDTVVDTANASYNSANLVVNYVVGKVSDISNHSTSSLSEGSNLYFTNARARTAISVTGSGSYDNATGVITITGGVSSVGGASGAVSNADLASAITSSGRLTTANVTELTNLYFTNARVYSNVTAGGFINAVSNTAPIGASASSGTLTLSHLNSGVTATTYGNATIIPIITVNASGHITSVSNAAISASGGGATVSNTTSSSTHYPLFTTTTTGTVSTVNITIPYLYFVPSTGTLSATNFNSLSDRSKKQNIAHVIGAMSTVEQLQGVEFNWVTNGAKSSGLIAQDIEQVLPHLVETGEDGTKTINYAGLSAYLIEAIKELNTRLKNLE